MSNAQRTRLAVAVLAWTLAGCGLSGCSAGSPQAAIPWRVEKGSEWAWHMDPEGDRSHILTTKVLDVGKTVKLAMTIEIAGETLHENVVEVQESAVPVALVAMSFGADMPKGEFEWVRSPEEQGYEFRLRQRPGKVDVYTTDFHMRPLTILVGGAMAPDIIVDSPGTTVLLPKWHVLEAKWKQ